MSEKDITNLGTAEVVWINNKAYIKYEDAELLYNEALSKVNLKQEIKELKEILESVYMTLPYQIYQRYALRIKKVLNK